MIEFVFVDQYCNMCFYIEEFDLCMIEFVFEMVCLFGFDVSEQSICGGIDGVWFLECGLLMFNFFIGGYDYYLCFEWNIVQNLVILIDFVIVLFGCWVSVI